MTQTFYDFNTAQTANNYDLIAKGTIAKVHLKIKPGDYDDAERGWIGGYATQNLQSGAVYLRCEFTILAGEFTGRKIWSMIGLFSHKNDNIWGSIGRTFIRSILNSKSGFTDQDDSPAAIAARQITSFAELDNSEFVARIDVELDEYGNERNVIKKTITPEHKQYSQVMEQVSSAANVFIDDEIPWKN